MKIDDGTVAFVHVMEEQIEVEDDDHQSPPRGCDI